MEGNYLICCGCRGGASVLGGFVVPGIQAHYKFRTKMCIYALSLTKVQQAEAKKDREGLLHLPICALRDDSGPSTKAAPNSWFYYEHLYFLFVLREGSKMAWNLELKEILLSLPPKG